MSIILTIGHSSHPLERFLALLRQSAVEVVVDTRSAPVSRFAPHFDREPLRQRLAESGVKYLFLGDQIGGRPKDPACYDANGRVLYSRLSAHPAFLGTIERLERGAADYRIALLCGEEDPAHCHRRLLIGRVLVERGHQLLHLRGDGTAQTDDQNAAHSGKPLVDPQPALFAEVNEAKWKSTASVSRKKPQPNSLVR